MTGGRVRWKLLAAGILLWAVFPVARAIYHFASTSQFSVCFFRTITGHSCPFCGLTRAFGAAAHGDFAKAFDYHPLWWVFALATAAAGTGALVDATAGTDCTGRLQRSVTSRPWCVPAAIVVLYLLRVLVFRSY